ncbi:hypothetical protein [Rubrivirga sp. IMCC45206]|uniref:hypothetical protein n=1 Tax=Rubrivirga sp. IMCC45206 TaxID=3391614 RepID=UPI00398FCA1F
MLVRLGLLAALLACAVAPASAGVPAGAAPLDGEQVGRTTHPGSAALAPGSGAVLAGATEEARPTPHGARAHRRGATRPHREARAAGVWTPTRRDVRPSARTQVLRL